MSVWFEERFERVADSPTQLLPPDTWIAPAEAFATDSDRDTVHWRGTRGSSDVLGDYVLDGEIGQFQLDVTNTRSGAMLDADSRRCLECHDGVNATDAINATAWNRGGTRIGNITTNHPVGIAYPPRKKRDEYRPASALPGEIQLPSGQGSCVSCHDLYARDRRRLTVTMDGSRLCYSCHTTK